jgi:DNA mismatch repair protein MutS2
MISQSNLELLEFNKLLKIISDIAKSPATKKKIGDIRPFEKIEDIILRQNLIKEILLMHHDGAQINVFDLHDLSDLFAKAMPEGSILDVEELAGFMNLFEIISDLLVEINKRKSSPFLKELIAPLTGFPSILRILKKSIDSEGNILDNASAQLFEIRARMRKITGRIRKKLEEILRDTDTSKFLQDEFITQRSGRWVIPVRMDSKGQIAGVVHDVSNSGQTAFVEPIAIISLSNEFENVIADEKAEVIRILRSLTSMIREDVDSIINEFKITVYFDVLNCISIAAQRLKMEMPGLNSSKFINIIKARHPLLQLSFSSSSVLMQVIPLDVKLGGDKSVMVITGANAGGKTITIKTVGLLQLMALSGMPVPADSSSSFPVLNNILVDIGDEQSIESNLSTFSAHITKISGIIRAANPQTLVLIDEIGKGTDPDEGAPLACSILNELKLKGSLVFATTHLSAIKGFVYKNEGMINASMEFDQKTFTPLYRLRIGEPGVSHAFETARKYGLPDNIIENAGRMLGNLKVEIDSLIVELNVKRQHYESSMIEIGRQQAELEEKNRLLSKRLSDIEDTSKEILSNAYRDATLIISKTRREIRDIIKQEKERKKEALKQLDIKQQELAKKISEMDKDKLPSPDIDEIKVGDTVFVRPLGVDARVIEKNAALGQLRISLGNRKILLPISDIGYSKGKTGRKILEITTPSPDTDLNTTLNIVGMRVDEALSALEPFLNQASLSGLQEIKVIHGIGKMILKKAVHEHLKGHPLIKSFSSAPHTEGGEGVTIIRLC